MMTEVHTRFDYFDEFSYARLVYGLGFLFAQVPAYVLLRYVTLKRTTSNIILLKATVRCLYFLPERYIDDPLGALNMFVFLDGVADGALLPAFAVFTWSWFPPHQVPARMLLWTLLGPVVGAVLGFSNPALKGEFWVYVLDSVFFPVLCFVLATVGSGLIGRPREVSWLDAPKKILFDHRAATHKYANENKCGDGPLFKVSLNHGQLNMHADPGV